MFYLTVHRFLARVQSPTCITYGKCLPGSIMPVQTPKSGTDCKYEKANININMWKVNIDTTIEKSFLIDPLTTNNAIYHDSLNLIISLRSCNFYFYLKHAEYNAA